MRFRILIARFCSIKCPLANSGSPRRSSQAVRGAQQAQSALIVSEAVHCGLQPLSRTPRTAGRTLAALMSTHSDEFSEGSQALERAVTELVASGVAEGSLRHDANAGAVMLALHGVGGAHDRANWRAEADGLVALLVDGLRPPAD
jgi:hypothetical protein